MVYNSLKDLVEPFFENYLEDNSYLVKSCESHTLLTWDRFDLAAKILFLEDIKNHRVVNNDIYAEHIKMFTLGSYIEPGNNEKNSLDKFKQNFISMYTDMQRNGFDETKSLIPCSESGTILNGSHRVACAIDLGIPVKAIFIKAPSQSYDYEFFKQRGASDFFLDRCATKFIESSPNTFVAVVWPSAIGKNYEILKILGKVVYAKELFFSWKGLHNLIAEIYHEEEWLGSKLENFPGAKGKLVPCYAEGKPIRVYVFQSDTTDDVFLKKQKIRDLFGLGKDSIHINDSHFESVHLASLFFNSNQYHFLNFGSPNKFISTYAKIEKFLKYCHKNKINLNEIVLDGGLVLSLYGLRESRDIDYIERKSHEIEFPDKDINLHNDELKFHAISPESLIFDNKYFFRFNGLKFLTLQQIAMMKGQRRETKDIIDLKIMSSFIKKRKLDQYISKGIYKLFYIKAKIITNIAVLFRFLRVYNFFRKIYHNLIKLEKLNG